MTSDRFDKIREYSTQKNIRFYLTAPQACPYLPDRNERKIFTTLSGLDSDIINEALTQAGFRRSQNISYRPACDMCASCVSMRVLALEFDFRKWKRVLRNDTKLYSETCYPEANEERFELITNYLQSRHAGEGMSDMSADDFIAMIEECTSSTRIIDYRLKDDDEFGKKGDLIACILIDLLHDGRSLVYSFYSPNYLKDSLGTYLVLDQIRAAKLKNQPYTYLGYWIKGSKKMEYKTRFRPFEHLGPQGWTRNGP